MRTKRNRIVALAAIATALALAAVLASAENVTTIRAIELRAQPALDAKSLEKYPAETVAELVKREGAWVQLKIGRNMGWTKLFDVRLASSAAPAKSASGSSLGQTLNLASGNRGASVTTGVRGLDEEMLTRASPNPQEFAKLETYAASKTDAQQFAKAGNLQARTVEAIK